MNILLTGGAGYIGSHTIIELDKAGHSVVVVDNLVNSKPEALNRVAKIIGKTVPFVEADIRDRQAMDKLFTDYKIDAVINFAGLKAVGESVAKPLEYYENNMNGLFVLVDVMRQHNCKNIIFSSSATVYGDPAIHPQPEYYWGNVNPIGIRSCYDEGKRCAESLAMDYHRLHGVRIKLIRIFNTYGPKMQAYDGRVVTNFVVSALKGEDITIYGDGKQTRSFQYVDDLVEGMIRMMATEDDFVGPVNIGNPGEFTMLELAEMVIRLTGSKSKITFQPLPQDDPKQRRPDITLAKEKLQWEPKVKLEDGLRKVIEYFEARRPNF